MRFPSRFPVARPVFAYPVPLPTQAPAQVCYSCFRNRIIVYCFSVWGNINKLVHDVIKPGVQIFPTGCTAMCTSNVKKERSSKPKRHNNKPCKIAKGIAYNMLKHAFLAFRSLLETFIDFIFGLIWEGSRQKLPDLEPHQHMLSESAVTLAAKIRSKQLKSEKLVQACIERIKTVNPIINAVTDERFEDALKEAREIDKQIEAGLSDEYFKEKPFLGVPFTAKESHAVAGCLHTLGVVSRKHTRAPADAECVRLLRAAGAVPIAVTNVPEINKWQETRNMVFGQTNNPYHPGRTVGGSSGGEAALHAALGSPISLCSDIGGSTRMPAFFNGLFGLNPTAGTTSLKGSTLRTGLDPTMSSIGFASKHCSDLAPLTKVVAGDKAKDLNLDRVVHVKDIKIFYTETAQDLRVSPICKDLRKAMSQVIQNLSEESRSTEQAPKPYYHRGFDHMFLIWKHGMTKETEEFSRMLTNNKGQARFVVELPKKLLGMSEYTSAALLKLADEQVMPAVDAEWADALTAELRDDLLKTLGSCGVLVFPAAPQPAPYHYSLLLRPFNFSYWGVFNALHFPACQVPLGLNSAGIPLGIQVVAAPHQEALCLAVAAHLEKAFGGYVPPCKV